MIKNRTVAGGRQFWDHCEKVAAEAATWPGWMRGETGGETAAKPFLRIGTFYRAWASEPLADFPMRLERSRGGFYYWAMARGGEYHWWTLINSTDSPKIGENVIFGSGTQTEASGTD